MEFKLEFNDNDQHKHTHTHLWNQYAFSGRIPFRMWHHLIETMINKMKKKWKKMNKNKMNKQMILKHLQFTTSFKSDEYYQRNFMKWKHDFKL